MKVPVPWNVETLLTSWRTISFSKSLLFRGAKRGSLLIYYTAIFVVPYYNESARFSKSHYVQKSVDFLWLVGILPRLRVGRSGVRIPARARDISLSKSPDQLWGPPSFLFSGYRGSFPRIKRPGREADHSPSSSADGKNKQSYTSTSPYKPAWHVHGKYMFSTMSLYKTPKMKSNIGRNM